MMLKFTRGWPVLFLDRRRSASRLQAGDDRVGDLTGADGGWIVAVGLHVIGHLPSLADRLSDGAFQHVGGVGLAMLFQHDYARYHVGNWVVVVQSGVSWGTYVV